MSNYTGPKCQQRKKIPLSFRLRLAAIAVAPVRAIGFVKELFRHNFTKDNTPDIGDAR